MNNAFNHGSQGDFFANALEGDEQTRVAGVSKAPAGTGALIRQACRDGKRDDLEALLRSLELGDV